MNDITEKEKGIISIIRLNKLLKKNEIRKKYKIGRLEIAFEWRSSKNLWGRFGGGWNWHLGFQIGGLTIIIFLLIFSIRINFEKK